MSELSERVRQWIGADMLADEVAALEARCERLERAAWKDIRERMPPSHEYLHPDADAMLDDLEVLLSDADALLAVKEAAQNYIDDLAAFGKLEEALAALPEHLK